MTDASNPVAQEASVSPTAGSLLRQARQSRGLHIAALATSIKVPPRKLELLEAVAVYFLPGYLSSGSKNPSPVNSQVSQASEAVIASASVVAAPIPPVPVELLPPADGASAAMLVLAPREQQAAPALAVSLLELRANQNAWVEVQDSNNKPLISRLVQAGEVVNLDGAPPLRLKVGNAANTSVRFRGQPVDLAPSTRDNVARIELK